MAHAGLLGWGREAERRGRGIGGRGGGGWGEVVVCVCGGGGGGLKRRIWRSQERIVGIDLF